jgi:hypothetical protein
MCCCVLLQRVITPTVTEGQHAPVCHLPVRALLTLTLLLRPLLAAAAAMPLAATAACNAAGAQKHAKRADQVLRLL